MKKILVTGSSGTIGTRLCETLLEEGYEVVGVDWKENNWNKEVDNLTIKLDLRNKEEVLKKLPNDINIIIHLAANARVYDLVLDPSLARDNMETTFNILEFSRINNIKKFIFASSRETYGNSEKTIYNESDVRIENCESPYTASKITGEALVYAYKNCYDLDSIIFRFSNIYGMYDESDRVIPLFIKQCLENKSLFIFGKDKLLDFTYIDDCVKGIILGIKNFQNLKNDVYNLAHGKGVSIFELAKKIKELTKSNSELIIKDVRIGEVIKYVADTSKIKEKMGFVPETSIQEGMEKTIYWYKNNYAFL
ncbi:MAG: SDR family NAD(P)-dependent oxidoreductase [Nanoarchaeota archaeon]|nr:SDR family NAD(P)-dependent oxidoreductase [Nanoarchaeota archaeon]